MHDSTLRAPFRQAWFIRNINEGGYTKDLEIRFDHEKEIAKINDKKKNKHGVWVFFAN